MPNRVISLQHPGTGSPFPGVWIEKQIAMKRFFLLLFLGTCPAVSAQVRFSDYFLEETMRFDYYHSGDSRSEEYFFDALKAEPYWAGSHVSLLDTTGYGNQFFRIVDRASEREIYSRGFCTLFNEWQSTAEADSVRRSYPESVVFPYPRRPCRIEIFGRNAGGHFEKRFSQNIDPASCFVAQFTPRYETFEVAYNGNPAHRVDIVLLPEGYGAGERAKFEAACREFAREFFSYSPFREYASRFNIRAVWAPSADSGVTIPGERVWRNTACGASFYTFGSERYQMVDDFQRLRDIAAHVPYDYIYVLSNTQKYGGGRYLQLLWHQRRTPPYAHREDLRPRIRAPAAGAGRRVCRHDLLRRHVCPGHRAVGGEPDNARRVRGQVLESDGAGRDARSDARHP